MRRLVALLAVVLGLAACVTHPDGAYGDGPSLYLRDPDGYKIELKSR